jgi:GT2 family glycosyltransferase
MGASAPRCTIVIPTYEGGMLTRTCLKALAEHPSATCDVQIVVVDDASKDDTQEILAACGSAVTVVTHKENRGFAAACNTGAQTAGHSDYLVFLNNDTIPTTGWLDALVDHAVKTPNAAAVGAKLLFPNGAIQHAGVAISQDGWPRHLYAGFPDEHPAVNRTRKVVAATAACLLICREAFAGLGGFDESFHNGFEDVDLCFRLGREGRDIWYCHRSVVYHLESVTRWPTGQSQGTEANERLYAERWLGKLAPDDLQHYLEDGLLEVEYGPYYPMTLVVSPHLASVRAEGDELAGLERLLSVRSRQVMEGLTVQIRSALRAGNRPELVLSRQRQSSGGLPPRILARGETHQLGTAGDARLVSLILPVKNQEQDVRELLPRVLEQRVSARLEIIAVDSGSRDGTVAALTELGATVLAIDPVEFDHGLTRNLAAQHAQGDVLLFLSGHSRPADEHWLAPLLGVLDEDPYAAGVCSRVLPGPSADLLTAKDGERELSGSALRERKIIDDWNHYRGMSVEQRRAFLNFHTVGAALRAAVFNDMQFHSVATLGEDLLWAREAIEAGWSLWHEPASVVYHSHNYSLRELFARNVDDGLANREINGRTLEESDVFSLIQTLVMDDWSYLKRTTRLGDKDLDSLQVESVLRRVAQVVGQWVGVNHGELPDEMATFFSGVHQARRSG